MRGANRIVTVDVTDIAEHVGLGPIVGVAALGAFAGATFLLGLDALLAAVGAGCQITTEAQTTACRDAYAEVTGSTFSSERETSAGGR